MADSKGTGAVSYLSHLKGRVDPASAAAHSHRGGENGRMWTSDHANTIAGARQGQVKGPLLVLGDKTGGAASGALAEDPKVLDHPKTVFGRRLRIVHHVRNPHDVVDTMARRSGATSVWASARCRAHLKSPGRVHGRRGYVWITACSPATATTFWTHQVPM
ncbi:MAG: hypothetical protein HKN91_16445 [Acidimicrobiia bacterium]|nr:hypothetical protein [Acidimicrobiia bacterium]